MSKEAQVTDTVFMVRPVSFYSNPETIASNAFQSSAGSVDPGIQDRAIHEFDKMVELLRSSGVRVIVAQDIPEPATPDSIFPNNWISFHGSGTAFIYPMCAPNRRNERTKELEDAMKLSGYEWNSVDLTSWENSGRFLEGTGSMVLDRQNKIAYACRSPRTDESVLQAFCENAGYKPVLFDAWHVADGREHRIYHTNVMLCIGTRIAVLCAESISNAEEQTRVIRNLEESGRVVITISSEQMNNYAGNMLELRSESGEPLMVMSARALGSLGENQVMTIRKYCRILAPDIATIETHGGGSARCMLAEVFLPPPK
ncbi:MAG: hypothetical protein RL220_358 [Bacteroidota bacterium]